MRMAPLAGRRVRPEADEGSDRHGHCVIEGEGREELRAFSRLLGNVFCPTGQGGGVDPSCSPGGKGGGALTQTPEFKAWFAGSKVVDSKGEPLKVYHGSRGKIDKYSAEHKGKTTD